jgi:serine phosphatase RsbU (regulator of sigma subunit)
MQRPMLPVQSTPEPPPTRRAGKLFVVWILAVAVIVVDTQITNLLEKFKISTGVFTFISFMAALVCIAVTMYAFAVVVRWMLRKLFWRVGRRLFLSYVMIGVLPFFLFGILLLTIGYMIAGVMTQAALRGERQASLGQMEFNAREYGLTGKRPADALSTLEIYDTADASGANLPAWLRKSTFSGMAWRDRQPLLVVSRQFPEAKRNVVFVQPLDRAWATELQERDGMVVRMTSEGEIDKSNSGADRPRKRHGGINISGDGTDEEFEKLVINSIGRKIIWPDVTDLVRWETGGASTHKLLTLIVNPVPNLLNFYFGAEGSKYLDGLLNAIAILTMMLIFIYMVAVMFAGVLIYSITRAVNRIEKGTKAVERGDFTYRIGMRPHNQLGEMAQSFDRMTESIASLLSNVAEKERLQSEIEIAATIQRNLLPKEGPLFRGVSFSAHFEPTTSIGGDYYDVFNLDKTRLAVAIGDVSGHGLSTGLVMAMVKAAMTTLVEEGADEVSLFRRLNELVYRSTERRAFMTLAFTIFDLERGTLRHTNAGHLYPYLLREGQPPLGIEVPSLPLGVRSEIMTRTAEVDLQEGDAIVYLSDGIVEAQDESGDPFGFDQLEYLLATAEDRSPSSIRDRILDAVARHSGTRPADDDRTIMVLRFDNFRTLVHAAPEEALAEATA